MTYSKFLEQEPEDRGLDHESEDFDFFETKLHKCDCECLWFSDCKSIGKEEFDYILNYGCEDYYSAQLDYTNDEIVDRYIEMGRKEYRDRWIQEYDQFQTEWN
jgi:hypothetical protein